MDDVQLPPITRIRHRLSRYLHGGRHPATPHRRWGAGQQGDARKLYLDLMKRCLTNWIYDTFEEQVRAEGRDWPADAHTMIGLRRLDNLQFCLEDVLDRGIPGDFIETGVWRGGSTIFMRAALKSRGITDRCVWVADSFEGLPPPNPEQYPLDEGLNLHVFKELAISLERVRANFQRDGLLDDQVRFLKGWFRDTLPSAPVARLAVVRLDGDPVGADGPRRLGDLPIGGASPLGALVADATPLPRRDRAMVGARLRGGSPARGAAPAGAPGYSQFPDRLERGRPQEGPARDQADGGRDRPPIGVKPAFGGPRPEETE